MSALPRIVELNGRLLPLEDARVAATDVGLLHGIGLFETMRACGGRVFRWRQHVERLVKSAEALGLSLNESGLAAGDGAGQVCQPSDLSRRLDALLRANKLTDARIRLTVTGGTAGQDRAEPTVLLTAAAVEPYPQEYYTTGLTVRICPYVQASTDPLAGHKTTCYWARLHALHQAQAGGCGEALWFNEKRQLAEGSISNVFIVKGGIVKTPPLDTPVLPGITRAVVIQLCGRKGIRCVEAALDINDLLDADEAFITNSMMGIVPVCRVERKVVGREKVGEMTMTLRHAYLMEDE